MLKYFILIKEKSNRVFRNSHYVKCPISHFSTNLEQTQYSNAGIPTVMETSDFAQL